MRKLKLQVQMTVDGFIVGPNGEMDWMTFPWTEDISEYVTKLTEPVDTILLGRNLAEGFIPYWTGVANDPSNPEQEAGKKYYTDSILNCRRGNPCGCPEPIPTATSWATAKVAPTTRQI